MNVAEGWRASVCMSDLPNLLHITHKSGKEKIVVLSSSLTKTRALDQWEKQTQRMKAIRAALASAGSVL